VRSIPSAETLDLCGEIDAGQVPIFAATAWAPDICVQRSTQMRQFAAKSVEASQLRQRKYALVQKFNLPEDLVGGSLSQTHRRCGRPNCHCAAGRGHPLWSVTFSRNGVRRVERVPREWVEEVERAVLATHAYLDAIREVMTMNLELLALTRTQKRQKKVRRPTKKHTPAPQSINFSPPRSIY
jgi:hypothetical protein